MKIWSVISITILLLLLGSCADKLVEGVDIQFSTDIYDFGNVDEGTMVAYSFKFKNMGKETLKIENVRPSCGCTIADNWDREVASGKSGEIPLVINTNGFQGHISKVVTIITNVPEKRSIMLKIEGTVDTPVDIIPRSVWLGEVEDKTLPLKGNVVLKNNMGEDFSIINVTADSENVTTTTNVVTEGKEYSIDFVVSPPFAGEEHIRGKLIMETDSKRRPTIEVSYSFFIPPDLHIYPLKVIIATDQTNQESERRISVKSRLKEPIQITDLAVIGSDKVDLSVSELEKGVFFQIIAAIKPGFSIAEGQSVFLRFKVAGDPSNQMYKIDFEEYQR